MIGYLRLVRLPNVFTALADILAGHWILFGAQGLPTPHLLLGSASLYLFGMADNDLADLKEDRQFRPNRPLPAGQISTSGAWACAAGLLLIGVALPALLGLIPLALALALAAAIVCYNHAAKHVLLAGPAALGACRFLNVLLGMSAHPDFLALLRGARAWEAPWAPALSVGIYAAGLTAFSAQEERGKQLRAILLGWFFCGTAILLAGLHSPSAWAWAILAPLGAYLVWLTVRLYRDGTPLAARNLVRSGVLGVCAVDAAMILGHGGPPALPRALACLALILPALAVGRWLAQKEA